MRYLRMSDKEGVWRTRKARNHIALDVLMFGAFLYGHFSSK